MAERVIIGLGNPILSDDSVGVKASRRLKEVLKDRPDIAVIELHAGGLLLMDALAGYRKAIIIDAMQTGAAPGTVRRFSALDLPTTRNLTSTHDVDLPTALELAKSTGLKMPDDITIYGIEVNDVTSFSEELTPEVEAALRDTVAMVVTGIEGSQSG